MNHSLIIVLLLLTSTSIKAQSGLTKETKMEVAVWDTYVTRKDGKLMHFDIITPREISDTTVVYGYGKDYLKTKGQEGQPLTSKECRLCHIETIRPQWELEISKKGYYIIEMENCE